MEAQLETSNYVWCLFECLDDTTHEETEALLSSTEVGGLSSVGSGGKVEMQPYSKRSGCVYLIWCGTDFLQPELPVDSQNQIWVTVHETGPKTIPCQVKSNENNVSDFKGNIRKLPNSHLFFNLSPANEWIHSVAMMPHFTVLKFTLKIIYCKLLLDPEADASFNNSF